MCTSVIVCQGPPTCTVPNLDRSLQHSPALPLEGWISRRRLSSPLLHIHFLSLFSLSLTSPFCNYKVASRHRRLSARDWLLDIESGKGRAVPSPPLRDVPSILLPGAPDGGVGGGGGGARAPVSAPALYPFLSITVQVKQMIGFSQRGD